MARSYSTMNKLLSLIWILCMFGCVSTPTIEDYGQHYQKHHDHASLLKVVELLPADADTAFVKAILGEPIDMGFDYRYLIDSTGAKGCVVGAVFHIGEAGIINQKWLDEICE